jgi:type II secretory pathway component GspD/PulD (secretin)
MSHKLPAFALAVIALLGVGYPAPGQASKQPDDAKVKRLAFVVKYGTAKELAEALTKHFKNDLDIVPEASTNVLLLSGKPAVIDEALATLAKLDRRPQLVAIEVWVLDLAPKKGADGKPAPGDVDEKALTGSAAAVNKYLKGLQTSGALEAKRRYSLTALENQPTRVVSGETKPYTTGVHTIGGKVTRTISYRDVGTSLLLTPRLDAAGAVTLELKFDDSRMIQPPDGIPLGKDENGVPIMATEFVLTAVNTKVNVAKDQAVLVQGVETKANAGGARTLIVVTAKVLP